MGRVAVVEAELETPVDAEVSVAVSTLVVAVSVSVVEALVLVSVAIELVVSVTLVRWWVFFTSVFRLGLVDAGRSATHESVAVEENVSVALGGRTGSAAASPSGRWRGRDLRGLGAARDDGRAQAERREGRGLRDGGRLRCGERRGVGGRGGGRGVDLRGGEHGAGEGEGDEVHERAGEDHGVELAGLRGDWDWD